MDRLDDCFRETVSAMDAGDIDALERLLAAHPRLARDRLDAPGTWLRDQVGDALDGFFRQPYLLWFVAEDPVRNGRLPPNIADVARTIIRSAGAVDSLLEQLDYALRLVCWSVVARDCGVQIPLMDVLLDAGASPDGRTVYQGRFGTHTEAAIYNRNVAAAEHLLARGAPVTLTAALCLARHADAERLLPAASREEREDAFVQAAMNGKAEALRLMLARGMPATTVSGRNQSHGTALHHAVWSGSLDAVRVLVEGGADLERRDTIYQGTPLDWAEHAGQAGNEPGAQPYRDIASYLRECAGR